MKTFYLLFCLLPLALQAQVAPDPATVSPRPTVADLTKPSRYLALDVIGGLAGFQRHRFHEGDPIRFRARTDRARYDATLYAVSDSSFAVLLNNEVMGRMEPVSFRFVDVHSMKITKRIPFVSAGAIMLPLAGIIYGLADFLNGGIDDGRATGLRRPRFDAASLVPTLGLIGAGGICWKLGHRNYRINDRHRLKLLQAL
jgi:hypothetical protein